MTSSPWFHPRPVPPTTRLKLLCIPFAGGGAGIYNSWLGAMPPSVHVLPVQLPGRERRLREPAIPSMKALVDVLLPACLPHLDGEWAVFGHSMGGGIAWELSVAAASLGKPPSHLFVSGRRAPGTPPVHPPLFALPKAELIREVERLYGPLPAVLKQHPSILDTFLPTMRADFRLIDTWVPSMDVLDDVPITVFGGRDDTAVPLSSLEAWRARTTGPSEVHVLEGGHFFVRESTDARNHVQRILAAR